MNIWSFLKIKLGKEIIYDNYGNYIVIIMVIICSDNYGNYIVIIVVII